MNIPIVTLAIVFLLIAVRQIGNLRLAIWQIMLGGAAGKQASQSMRSADRGRSSQACLG